MSQRYISAALLLFAAAGSAQRRAQDLTEASLEELMNMEVTSVSRKGQRLSRTAASVYVISQEDIRRSGMTSVPELLRMAPGVQVGRIDAFTWAISIRGFNEEFASKLLVLVDGRSVYSDFFSGVYWETQETLLDNIDRIEIIRGPGAALWGANAVNGVINIITKHSEETQGGMISGIAGSREATGGGMRYGGRIGGKAQYRIFAGQTSRDVFHPEGGEHSGRKWSAIHAGFRADWSPTKTDSILIHGNLFANRASELHQSFEAGTGTYWNPIRSIGGSMTARWDRALSGRSIASWQFSWDRLDRQDMHSPIRHDLFDLSFQHQSGVGESHAVVWGGGYRGTAHRFTPTAYARLDPARQTTHLFSAFAQDEWTLVPDRLAVIGGVWVEHNSFTGIEAQPTARVLWTPSRTATTWAAISRAVRTPSLVERGIWSPALYQPGPPPQLITVEGSRDFRSETLRAVEAGQRFHLPGRVSIDLSLFDNQYSDLRSVGMLQPRLAFENGSTYLLIPTRFGNDRFGSVRGGDVSLGWQPHGRWRLSAGYSYLSFREGTREGATILDTSDGHPNPAHQWQLHSYLDVTRTLQVDAALYYTGSLAAGQTGRMPSHLRGDLHIGWRLTPNLEIGGGIRDAFDPDHSEFNSTRLAPFLEIERSIYVNVLWKF